MLLLLLAALATVATLLGHLSQRYGLRKCGLENKPLTPGGTINALLTALPFFSNG